MTMEDSGPNSTSDHILDWVDGSISFLPSVLDDIYNPVEIETSDDYWWVHNQEFDHDLLYTSSTSTTNPVVPNSPQLSADSSKKRKPNSDDGTTAKAAKPLTRKNQSQEAEEGSGVGTKKASKRQTGRSSSSSNNNNNSHNGREGRWAEQLLNPCAAAITAGNMTRVQHLLYVLHELASSSGDSNHRLASHGLKALTHHLSSGVGAPHITKPHTFQKSLMRFDEVSPYFMFPNKIANSSILQILLSSRKPPVLHILDIGVSHGIQWPTLFEALSRRPGGPPSLVRLTVVGSGGLDGPFSSAPPGHTDSPHLLGFAKSINLNLQINRLDDVTQLQNLLIKSSSAADDDAEDDETLIVCAQFRLHQLSHQNPDQRSDLLKVIRGMRPKGMILSENNSECSCISCSGDYATGFKRRVEFLWRFLDSTSAAFKGRESDERRVMEGEAAKALTSVCEMNEGRDKWCERMRRCGFVAKGFGEEVIDEARALLRKYDGGWEMRTEQEESGCVGLWWKSQPVSFCSLWGICPN